MAEMDQGLKRAVTMRPEDWLAFTLTNGTVVYLGMAPTDVATEPQRILDTLLRVTYDGVECLVNIEFEARPGDDIGERLHLYAARATSIHKLKVISVVFWLTPSGQAPTSPTRVAIGNLPLYDQHFIGIEAYRLAAPDLMALAEQGAYGLLPLVPFSNGGETLEAAERAARLALTSAPTEQAEPLAVLVGVFAARKLGQNVAEAMLRRLLMSSNTLELSPLYLKWVEEGREKGLEEGLRNSARLILQGRFGAVPPEMEAAIVAASHAQLDDFMLHAATETLDELRTRLGA